MGFVDPPLFAAENLRHPRPEEKPLAGTRNLRSAPMAALHLVLDRVVDVPAEHVVLYKSRFLTSFIDLKRPWGLDHSEISIIASDFVSLESLTNPSDPDVDSITAPAAQPILDELIEYVPEIQRSYIDTARSVSIFTSADPFS